MKKKMFTTVLAVGAIVAVFAATPAMAAFNTYTAYSLPAFSQNNYTTAHTKTTNDQFIENKVSAMTNTSSVDFWACDVSKNQISLDYVQTVGSDVQLKFNSSQQYSGNQVIMGMQNDEYDLTTTGFVSGSVDFR